MMTLRQRSVNVDRLELLAALKKNLDLHQAEYKQALLDFKERLVDDLKLAIKKVVKTEDVMALKKFEFNVDFPQNHEREYREVIEMLEMSKDDNITLDAESFRAYVKNEWSWKASFDNSISNYKMAGSFVSM